MAGHLRLYVVPASHPCAAAERALQLKHMAYDRVSLLPVLHAVHQRIRFGRRTVPAVVFPDGTQLVGTRAILGRLDELVPEPRLVPADPDLRARVEAAESWGDVEFQPVGRRVGWTAMSRAPERMLTYAEGHKLPIPRAVAGACATTVIRAARLANRADEASVRADLQALPANLDRIDAWIADGTIGGPQPNVADLQLLSTVRLLGTLEDLRPLFAGRPADVRATALFPAYAGSVPAGMLPADWLPSRRAASP